MCKKFIYKLSIFLILSLGCEISHTYAQNTPKTIPAEFSHIDSKNAPLYLKPLITTIHQSLTSSLFTEAHYQDDFSLGFDISVAAMKIPESAKNYTSSIPDIYVNNTTEYQTLTGTGIHNPVTIQQPTIYGGTSTPLFVVGQNKTAKSLASLDGKNIDAIFGLPIIQLSLNLPIYSQGKFCAAYYNQGDVSLSFLRVGYNQRIDKLIKGLLHDQTMAIALHGSFNEIKMAFGDSIQSNFSSLAIGIHASKKINKSFMIYAGFQWEDIQGGFDGARKKMNGQIDSPYPEVRNNEHLQFNFMSDNSYKMIVGLKAKYGIIDMFTDISLASQTMINSGFSVYFFRDTDFY